jgi:hypothetical protein
MTNAANELLRIAPYSGRMKDQVAGEQTGTQDVKTTAKTGRLNRETLPEALYQVFGFGHRKSASAAEEIEGDPAMMMQGTRVQISGVLSAGMSLEYWQQQTILQFTQAVQNVLSIKNREADASYVKHLHEIQQAGEITLEQYLDRVQHLCPDEISGLPSAIRAKLASIKHILH